mmetsp:Transcript_98207/g.253977  ORF Transcript_98207/g.253977 Transcript_98207/m.253977 type:complete len:259 (-) Transcript_98207:213-989(-)
MSANSASDIVGWLKGHWKTISWYIFVSSALSWIRTMKGFSAGGSFAGGGAFKPPLATIISRSGSSCSAEVMPSTAVATARPSSIRMSCRSSSSSKAPPAPQRNSSPRTSRFFANMWATFSSSSLERLYRSSFSVRFVPGSRLSSGFRSIALRSSACATFRRSQSAAKARQNTSAFRSAAGRLSRSRVATETSASRCGTRRNFRSLVLMSSSSSLGENRWSCRQRHATAFSFADKLSTWDCSTVALSAFCSSLQALYTS